MGQFLPRDNVLLLQVACGGCKEKVGFTNLPPGVV